MVKINFLDKDSQRRARRATITVAAVFALFVGGLATFGAAASYRAATHGVTLFGDFGGLPLLSQLRSFVGGESGASAPELLSTPDNKLNILLLGIGGEGHDGPQLTDTIIYASYDKTTNKLGLVSIPRDLAYPLGGGRFEKINAVNAWDEVDHPGQGAKDTADAFSKLFNVRIDRVVKIDFKGFEDLVDALGGIDVNVENSFVDHSYPTDDNGPNPNQWMTVTFTKGMEHMDGKRALQFVRSRHGTNNENSDFARSRRQQLVISAVRSRLLSLGTLSNPKTVTDIWTAMASHIQTDLTAWDLLKLVPLALHFQPSNLVMNVLTDDPTNGQLVAGNVGGGYMLFPKKPDWSEIRDIMSDPTKTKADAAKEIHAQEPIVIEIRNGTYRTGFAAQVATKLQTNGYTVAALGNATRRSVDRTVIYDLTNGAKPTELARLKKTLDANVSIGGNTEPLSDSSTQFVIVLGDSSLGLIN